MNLNGEISKKRCLAEEILKLQEENEKLKNKINNTLEKSDLEKAEEQERRKILFESYNMLPIGYADTCYYKNVFPFIKDITGYTSLRADVFNRYLNNTLLTSILYCEEAVDLSKVLGSIGGNKVRLYLSDPYGRVACSIDRDQLPSDILDYAGKMVKLHFYKITDIKSGMRDNCFTEVRILFEKIEVIDDLTFEASSEDLPVAIDGFLRNSIFYHRIVPENEVFRFAQNSQYVKRVLAQQFMQSETEEMLEFVKYNIIKLNGNVASDDIVDEHPYIETEKLTFVFSDTVYIKWKGAH